MTARHLLHIAGEDRAAAGATLPVFDPCTGRVDGEVAAASAADVDEAVAAAQAALPAWSSARPSERAQVLSRVADALESELDTFAAIESRDTGKPLALCRDIEIPRAVANLRFFAAAAMTFGSESHHGEAGLNYTLRLPLGVGGGHQPLESAALPVHLEDRAGAGGRQHGGGQALRDHPRERQRFRPPRHAGRPAARRAEPRPWRGPGRRRSPGAASWRESRQLHRQHGGRTTHRRVLRRTSEEGLARVGGKNATLAFEDITPGEAAPLVLRAAFPPARSAFAARACWCRAPVLPNGAKPSPPKRAIGLRAHLRMREAGSARSHRKRTSTRCCGYLALADDEGGRVIAEGRIAASADAQGWWLAPRVIEGLPIDSRCATEEIFGPVLSLHAFADEAEAVAMANATTYGLAATILTNDLARAHRVAAALEVGLVWINTWMARDLRVPFGGTRQSGLGREGGWEAMRFFTEPRNVCLAT